MMVDSSEMRDFRRMSISCKAQLENLKDGSVLHGSAVNLSATGILLECEQALTPGEQYRIRVVPEKPVVTPLDAVAEVLRVEPAPTAGSYRVAFAVKEMR